jgi:hypothetical protein
LILVTATGTLARQDMDDLRAKLLSDERITGDMKLLFETKDADPRLTFSDLQEIAARLQGLFDKGINRVAVVADSTFTFSLATTFGVFAEREQVAVRPFRKVDDAVKCLRSAA